MAGLMSHQGEYALQTKDWFLIFAGTKAQGPLDSDEVLDILSQGVPAETLIVRAGREPVICTDDAGLAELFAARPLRRSIALSQFSAEQSIFNNSEHYGCASTEDMQCHVDTFHKKTQRTRSFDFEVPTQPNNPETAQQNLQKRFSVAGVFKALFAIGVCALIVRSADDHSKSRLNKLIEITPVENSTENLTRSEGTSRLGFSALAPESLTAFNATIESKLARDPKAYAKALLRLDLVRNSFPNGTIPSKAFVAATAMLSMADDELDRDPKWKNLLEKLGDDTRKGLAVVSYETARTRRVLGSSLDKLFEKGASSAGTGPWLHGLWAVPKTKFVLPGILVASSFEDVRQSLERIEKVFPTVAEGEKIYRNQLAARALWNGIQYSWLLGDKASKKSLQATLERWRNFAESLSVPDRDILIRLSTERLLALDGKITLKEAATERQKLALVWHADSRFMCQPRDTAIGSDYLLQTMRLTKSSKAIFLEIDDVFAKCFVGAKPYSAVQKYSFDVQETPMLVYLPRVTPGPQNRMAFHKVWSVSSDFGNFKASPAVGPENAWLMYAYFAEITDFRPAFDLNNFNLKCKKREISNRLCLQLAYRMSPDIFDKVQLLSRISDEFSLQDSQNLAFALAADAYTGRINVPGGKETLTRDTTLKTGFAQFINPDYPEFSALEWYMRNGNTFDR